MAINIILKKVIKEFSYQEELLEHFMGFNSKEKTNIHIFKDIYEYKNSLVIIPKFLTKSSSIINSLTIIDENPKEKNQKEYNITAICSSNISEEEIKKKTKDKNILKKDKKYSNKMNTFINSLLENNEETIFSIETKELIIPVVIDGFLNKKGRYTKRRRLQK